MGSGLERPTTINTQSTFQSKNRAIKKKKRISRINRIIGFVYKKKPTYLERFYQRRKLSARAAFFFVDGGSIN